MACHSFRRTGRVCGEAEESVGIGYTDIYEKTLSFGIIGHLLFYKQNKLVYIVISMSEYILMDSINKTYFTGNIAPDKRRKKQIFDWVDDINKAKIYSNVEELIVLVKNEKFTDVKIIEDPINNFIVNDISYYKKNKGRNKPFEKSIKIKNINFWTEIINMKRIEFNKYNIIEEDYTNCDVLKGNNFIEYLLKNEAIINNILNNKIIEYYYKEKLHINNIYNIPEDLINIFEYELEIDKNEVINLVTKIIESEFGNIFDINLYIIEKETVSHLYEYSIILLDANNKQIILLDIKTNRNKMYQ
jgi:hypothetical protein